MQQFHPSANQLSMLTEKRLALESLIKITVSIQIQQKSLLELSVIAKPSQEFPAKLIRHIKQLSQRIGDLPVSELIQRLEAIEKVMARGLGKILQLAKIDANALRSDQIDDLSIDDFVGAIDNFKRRTQTAVALRYLLIDRGVAIAPFPLTVPQESIVGQITELKIKEKHCVKQVKKEIMSIIKDSQAMLKQEHFSKAMKVEIAKVHQAMQINLEHIDRGGEINDIPNVFETLVLESASPETVTNSEIAINEQSKGLNHHQSTTRSINDQSEPESFWALFKKWLASPWNVSWRSLKETSRKH